MTHNACSTNCGWCGACTGGDDGPRWLVLVWNAKRKLWEDIPCWTEEEAGRFYRGAKSAGMPCVLRTPDNEVLAEYDPL